MTIDRYPDVAQDRAQAWRLLADRKPLEDEIDLALRGAYSDAGVCVDDFQPDYLLGPKLHEVLIHGAKRLGNPLLTLADVKELLK